METIESLHAITAWTPLNKTPPLSSECEKKVAATVSLLLRLKKDKPVKFEELTASLLSILQQIL
jgi:hypothetical protein